ncbi:LLM class flavin-dependent oxidoreductase [Leuconostoc lactis]|uniref:LLM class flavin-dependent oxidoreductase n=1 Tax=Leuconostoc lactis TaxID=1246 RepID=UPI00189A2B6F|nr:LLM class flavin-dependent oxidoreductase [Leuconostoc lactis]
MAPEKVILGLDTFGDVPKNSDGQLMTYAQALRQVVKEAVLADKLGVDVITLGEHHREEFAISSPETVLAAIATQTKQITLGSGVTVLSSDDPVRVFERFSTLDAVSNGRAQIILGRGSFTESFPLFGYDLGDYDALFEEKIAMFSKLLEEKPFDWQGEFTQSLKQADVFPKTESGHLDTWVGVGGSPESIVRAAHFGFPVILAIIGGDPIRFKPYVELYERAAKQFEMPTHPLGMHSHGFIADTQEAAVEMAWENIKLAFDKIGVTRGWAPMSREHFEHEIQSGSMYVGTPEVVAQRMAKAIKTLGVGRFDLVYGAGEQPAAARERMIELYATEVIPRVRELLAED